eukprot:m.172920 g.172920  ORF g.172920 m.172920 type:complete len:738 (+) comp25229_c0_seq2:30-2243(+)
MEASVPCPVCPQEVVITAIHAHVTAHLDGGLSSVQDFGKQPSVICVEDEPDENSTPIKHAPTNEHSTPIKVSPTTTRLSLESQNSLIYVDSQSPSLTLSAIPKDDSDDESCDSPLLLESLPLNDFSPKGPTSPQALDTATTNSQHIPEQPSTRSSLATSLGEKRSRSESPKPVNFETKRSRVETQEAVNKNCVLIEEGDQSPNANSFSRRDTSEYETLLAQERARLETERQKREAADAALALKLQEQLQQDSAPPKTSSSPKLRRMPSLLSWLHTGSKDRKSKNMRACPVEHCQEMVLESEYLRHEARHQKEFEEALELEAKTHKPTSEPKKPSSRRPIPLLRRSSSLTDDHLLSCPTRKDRCNSKPDNTNNTHKENSSTTTTACSKNKTNHSNFRRSSSCSSASCSFAGHSSNPRKPSISASTSSSSSSASSTIPAASNQPSLLSNNSDSSKQKKTFGADNHALTEDIMTFVYKACKKQQAHRGGSFRMCRHADHFEQNWTDGSWACGYRNIQILCSSLMRKEEYRNVLFQNCGFEGTKPHGVPTVPCLQHCIEAAWEAGYDPDGRQQLGRVVGTTKWIGTTECVSLLRSFGVRAEFVDFHAKGKEGESHQQLVDWVWMYFANAEHHLANPVARTNKPPLYFQHSGHSRSIVGIEKYENNYSLLVLDPLTPGRKLTHTLSTGIGWQRLLKRSVRTLKMKQYQLAFAKGFVTKEEERALKKLRPLQVFGASSSVAYV